jgi:hypothetical protein
MADKPITITFTADDPKVIAALLALYSDLTSGKQPSKDKEPDRSEQPPNIRKPEPPPVILCESNEVRNVEDLVVGKDYLGIVQVINPLFCFVDLGLEEIFTDKRQQNVRRNGLLNLTSGVPLLRRGDHIRVRVVKIDLKKRYITLEFLFKTDENGKQIN